jgi:hypothetical protein
MSGGFVRVSPAIRLPVNQKAGYMPKNCGECLVQHVEVVKLDASGNCPCCAKDHKPEYDALVDLINAAEKACHAQGMLGKVIALRNLQTVLQSKPKVSHDIQRAMAKMLFNSTLGDSATRY